MSALSNQRKKKASRITTACNPCRSRKQKCSGKRPICEECIDYNRTCAWPEQLKRGPTKGYVEALEQRLHETEEVLLSILSQLTHAQLSSMLSVQDSFPREVRPQEKRETHTPMLPSRNRGVEYWRSFPLSDVESIQRWKQDCNRTRSRLTPSQDDGDSFDSSQTPRRVSTRDSTEVNSTSEETQISGQVPRSGPSNITSEGVQGPPAHFRRHTVDYESESRLLQPGTDFYGHASREPDPCPPPDIPKQFSSWAAAPSIRFQQQFLW